MRWRERGRGWKRGKETSLFTFRCNIILMYQAIMGIRENSQLIREKPFNIFIRRPLTKVPRKLAFIPSSSSSSSNPCIAPQLACFFFLSFLYSFLLWRVTMRNKYLSNISHAQWRGNLRAATSRLNIRRLPRSNCTDNHNNVQPYRS